MRGVVVNILGKRMEEGPSRIWLLLFFTPFGYVMNNTTIHVRSLGINVGESTPPLSTSVSIKTDLPCWAQGWGNKYAKITYSFLRYLIIKNIYQLGDSPPRDSS